MYLNKFLMATYSCVYKWLIATFFGACLVTHFAYADDLNMRPGLWEMTTESDLLMFAKQIPPEQMQQVEALAKQYGVDMPKIKNGAAVSKVCITPQMSQQKQLPTFYQSESGCKSTKATRVGNQYTINFECNSANVQGKGSASGQLISPDRFTGNTKFIGTAQGNPLNEQADIYLKWLSADCGDVKPM